MATNGYENHRENTVDQTNSISYSVMYLQITFESKWKLIMFEVTHFLAVDGYSGMVDSHFIVTENSKSNMLYFTFYYRNIIIVLL